MRETSGVSQPLGYHVFSRCFKSVIVQYRCSLTQPEIRLSRVLTPLFLFSLNVFPRLRYRYKNVP